MRIMVIIKGSRTVSNQEYVLKYQPHHDLTLAIRIEEQNRPHFGPFLDPPGALSKA